MQSLWMVVASLFFAFYAVCTKLLNNFGFDSFQILFYRSLFGVFFFYFWMRCRGVGLTTRYPLAHFNRSVIGTIAVLAGIYAITKLNIGLAMTLNYTSPLFLGSFVIAIGLIHHSRINWKLISTLIGGFLGVVILLSPTIDEGEYFAATVGLFSGLTMACAAFCIRKLGSLQEPELRVLFYFVSTGTLMGLIGSLWSGFNALSWEATGVLLGLALCGSLAQVCLTRAFSRGNMVLSGALQYCVILFSTLLGEVFFDEPVTLPIVVGMVIITLSGILASFLTRQEQKLIKKNAT